jgi:hypothetical protein
MRRVVFGVALVVAAVAIAVGLLVSRLGDGPAPTPAPSDATGPFPITRPARVLQSVPLHRAPGGPAILDEFGQNEELARVGQLVTVLEAQVVPGSGQWVRVFMEVDPNAWPGDFYAWLPVAAGGKPVLELGDAPACPEEPTLETLAALSPFDRLRCAGDRPKTMDARTVFGGGYAAYRVDPAFFGGREDTSALIGLTRPEKALGMYADTTGTWLDAVVAPGVPMPPVDVDVRLTGQFDHPAAAACRRTYDVPAYDPPPPAEAGLPPEAPTDSVAWCRARFVITAWTMTAGPERRPPVEGDVQLHRRAFSGACAGVGMDGPLTFRIDLAQADPVWIQGPRDALRIVPRFSSAFAFVKDPQPGISDGAGLVIRDGTTFDPDSGLPGHAACTEGGVIDFD